MFGRNEPTAEKIKCTVDKGLKKAVATLSARRGTTNHGLRPRYPPERRAFTPSVSPKQGPSLTKAARVATKARKIRQWTKSTYYCSDPPDSPQFCIAERAYENGQYVTVTDPGPNRLSRLIYHSRDSTALRSRAWAAEGPTTPPEQIIPPPTTPPLAPKKPKGRNALEYELSPPPLLPRDPQRVEA